MYFDYLGRKKLLTVKTVFIDCGNYVYVWWKVSYKGYGKYFVTYLLSCKLKKMTHNDKHWLVFMYEYEKMPLKP